MILKSARSAFFFECARIVDKSLPFLRAPLTSEAKCACPLCRSGAVPCGFPHKL